MQNNISWCHSDVLSRLHSWQSFSLDGAFVFPTVYGLLLFQISLLIDCRCTLKQRTFWCTFSSDWWLALVGNPSVEMIWQTSVVRAKLVFSVEMHQFCQTKKKKKILFVKSSWNSWIILGQLVDGSKLLHCFRVLLKTCVLWPLSLLWSPLTGLLPASPMGDGITTTQNCMLCVLQRENIL